jgi:hypothetical protein
MVRWTNEYMGKIKSVLELRHISNGEAIYYWLLKNKPELLKKIFPHKNKGDEKKAELIRLAQEGKAKPHCRTVLGAALSAYIYDKKIKSAYDENFTKKLKTLRPDWFITPKMNFVERKAELIRLAESGAPKPLYNTKLGMTFRRLTKVYSKPYDEDFSNQIIKLRPDWFEYNKTRNKKGQFCD